VTGPSVPPVRVTVIVTSVVPASPSARAKSAAANWSVPGLSSSVIVSVAVSREPSTAPPPGLVSVRLTVSSDSWVVSLFAGSMTIPWPATWRPFP